MHSSANLTGLLAGCVALTGGVGAMVAGASAVRCGGSGAPPPNVGSENNRLEAVAATSACNAWAVGHYFNGTTSQTLILRWNGKAWKVQESPNPGGSDHTHQLFGVSAVSRNNAWAVGEYYRRGAYRTLILHWDGRAWKVQKSPNPGGVASHNFNELTAVTAVSRSDAWAVGYYDSGDRGRTLVLHWNGRAWKVQRSPNPGGASSSLFLYGVSAVSRNSAWAAGYYYSGTAHHTLILRWNGKSWKAQKSPSPGGSSTGRYSLLYGLSAVSSSDAWAAGFYSNGNAERTLILRWNGKAWKVQESPNPGGTSSGHYLFGVNAASANDAWAVGRYTQGTAERTLILHWNGRAWRAQTSPSPSAFNVLYGVSAFSRTGAWCVGYHKKGETYRTLILRWNGKAWKG